MRSSKFIGLFLLTWLLVPVTGTGTRRNPYRADWPVFFKLADMEAVIGAIPGFKATCQFLNNPVTGAPTTADVYCWIPDRITLPVGTVTITQATARTAVRGRSGASDPVFMELGTR
jgi:hypothetical protein